MTLTEASWPCRLVPIVLELPRMSGRKQPVWLNSHPTVDCDPWRSPHTPVWGRLKPVNCHSLIFFRPLSVTNEVSSLLLSCFRKITFFLLSLGSRFRSKCLAQTTLTSSPLTWTIYEGETSQYVRSIHGVTGGAGYWPSLSNNRLRVPPSWFVWGLLL